MPISASMPRVKVARLCHSGATWGVWHYPLLLTTGAPTWPLLVEFTIGTVTMSVFLWLVVQ